MTKKVKKISIIGIVALLLIIAIFFIFSKSNKDQEVVEAVLEEKAFDCDSINYSRLSFFNTSDDRASLNIPESWEGSYRLKEEGAKAVFYYLLEDGSVSKMFSINKKSSSDKDDEVICEKENLKFVLDIYNLETAVYYDKISDGFQCIKESVKCY